MKNHITLLCRNCYASVFSRSRRLLWVPVVACTVMGCAQQTRPAPLTIANESHHSAAIKQAQHLAPQQYARADALRRQAEKLYQEGKIASSSIVAERAIVAYDRVSILARLAQAHTQASAAQAQLDKLTPIDQSLEAEQERLKQDIAAVEQLIKTVKDTPPLTPSTATDPSRQQARIIAARSMIMDARLLCSAARLLNRAMDGLKQTEEEVQMLEKTVAQWPTPAPIDAAITLRNKCLSFVTLARTPEPAIDGKDKQSIENKSNFSRTGDELLTELSQIPNLRPSMDERGIVVIVTGDPNRDSTAREVLQAVINSAKNNTNFPIQVVTHTRSKPTAQLKQIASQRTQTIIDVLKNAGISETRIEAIDAGPYRPVVHDPIPPPSNSQNNRIEIVLISPT